MKEIPTVRYQCEICKKIYDQKGFALKCESRPISQDKGVKVGDTVKILKGEGKGQLAKVSSTWLVDLWWGHYAADAYHHTVMIAADLEKNGRYDGTRQLCFTDYEPLK